MNKSTVWEESKRGDGIKRTWNVGFCMWAWPVRTRLPYLANVLLLLLQLSCVKNAKNMPIISFQNLIVLTSASSAFFFFFLNPGLEMTDSSRVFDRLEFNPVFDHRSTSYSVSSQHQKLLDRRWACGRKWTERKEVRLDEPQRSGGTERQLGHEWVANEERLERSLLGRWICRITFSQWR